MAEKVPSDNSKELSIRAFEDISVSDSDIIISGVGQDGVEREIVFPADATTAAIAISTGADLNLPTTPAYQERFIEQLDDIRTKPYVKEVEFELKGPELKWPPSLASIKIKVQRGLKVIKSYKKEAK